MLNYFPNGYTTFLLWNNAERTFSAVFTFCLMSWCHWDLFLCLFNRICFLLMWLYWFIYVRSFRNWFITKRISVLFRLRLNFGLQRLYPFLILNLDLFRLQKIISDMWFSTLSFHPWFHLAKINFKSHSRSFTYVDLWERRNRCDYDLIGIIFLLFKNNPLICWACCHFYFIILLSYLQTVQHYWNIKLR